MFVFLRPRLLDTYTSKMTGASVIIYSYVCVCVYTCMCVLELVEKSKVSNLENRIRRNLFLYVYLFLVYCYISFPNAISNLHSYPRGKFLLYFSSNSMQPPPSSASDEKNINLLVPLSILRMTRNLKVPTQDYMDGVKQLQISGFFCNTRHLYHFVGCNVTLDCFDANCFPFGTFFCTCIVWVFKRFHNNNGGFIWHKLHASNSCSIAQILWAWFFWRISLPTPKNCFKIFYRQAFAFRVIMRKPRFNCSVKLYQWSLL